VTVVAEVVRNDFVESRHHGRVALLDRDGSLVEAVGAVDAPMFARSSLKPVQALAMLRAGWQPPDDETLAVACASHSGEQMHVAVVRRLLGSAGLDESALDNTPGLPLDKKAAREVLCSGGGPTAVRQNCSGKHAAMLAACVANGWPLGGYRDPSHPVQQAVRSALEDLAGEPVAATAVDGCGAALFAVSLVGLARAFASLARATAGPQAHVADAMRSYPELVGGTGRDVTELMRAVPGLVAKDGAEGVYAAALPDGRAVAVKIDDGASRARVPVLVAGLRRLGCEDPALEAMATLPVLGHGEPVGEVRALL
jgi:L-asparaginase II